MATPRRIVTALADPRRVALTALAVVGDLAGVSVSFCNGGGALISVHGHDAPFMSRLLDLTGLLVGDASDPTQVSDCEVVRFERHESAHLDGEISASWFIADGDLSLRELSDYRHVIEDDMA